MYGNSKGIVMMTLVTVMALFAAIFGTISIASEANSKFVSRIIRKQQSLMRMGQSADVTADILKKYLSSNKNTINSVGKVIEESATLSDSKYIDRLERKLGAMVKEAVLDVECVKFSPSRPVFSGNLLPESQFKLEKIKEKILEERKKVELNAQ